MTQAAPPRSPDDRQFARDVAKQIDRRRGRRRLTLWSALLALVAAGATYLRCGSGLGLGGDGGGLGGHGSGEARPVAGPVRCAIHVSAAGFTVGGKPLSRDAAVAACKAAPATDIFVTGDARAGDPEELKAALEAADAKNIAVHSPPVPTGEPPAAPRGNPRATPGEPPHR